MPLMFMSSSTFLNPLFFWRYSRMSFAVAAPTPGSFSRSACVAVEEVVRRDPEVILASWCGRKVDLDAVRSRPGWEQIAAVRTGRIYEIDGGSVLAPGPSIMVGLRQVHEIIQNCLM